MSIDVCRRLLLLLSPKERWHALLVVGLMVLLALFEMAGVASVMPFLAVVGNPGMIEENRALLWLYERGDFTSTNQFLVALGIGAFALVICSAMFRIAVIYVASKFAHMRRYSIAARLLSNYLRRPYEFFLTRNSAALSKSILSEVDDLVDNLIRSALDVIAYGLIAACLAVLLLIVDPLLALIVAAVVASTYGLIYYGFRGFLKTSGWDRVEANRQRFTVASEAFGGIKELKASGREEEYIDRFQDPAERFARHQALSAILASAPKFLVEAVGFGGLIAITVFLIISQSELGRILPILGLYAFAGYRILPAAQHIYAGLSRIRFGTPALEAVCADLRVSREAEADCFEENPRSSKELHLDRGVFFDGVEFSFPGAPAPSVEGLTFAIQAGSWVGIVGETGCGKTTTVDLLLGLLRPTGGRIRVDDQPLDKAAIAHWRRKVGYVPQDIFLADASIAENIGFGLPPSSISLERVREVSRMAMLDEFVETELSEKYGTVVGERGVRLSGGQRQRIGLARGLFHAPDVLVLDEATSALDAETEAGIMQCLEKLRGELTIVIVAHRLNTIRRCDNVLLLHRGRLEAVGGYAELASGNTRFRNWIDVADGALQRV